MKQKNLIFNSTLLLLAAFIIIANSCKKEVPIISPTVNTNLEVTNITATTAKSGGIITNDNGETVTSRGVCWSIEINPTIKDSLTKDGSGAGAFASNLKNLSPNTSYYLRAYATNKFGTVYGNAINFITTADFAKVSTTQITQITTSTAVSGGNITNDGNSSITARGICWSTSSNPTTSNNKTLDGIAMGIYTSNMTDLLPGKNYYVRAYATNSKGTSYGNTLNFTTSITLPTISTALVSGIGISTAICGGDIISDGGSTIIQKGICWSTNSGPTIELTTKSVNGSGTGSFTSTMANLEIGTTYYVRSYATNDAGTAYGSEVKFTTNSVSVGNKLFGGIVFYIDGTGKHGLVCAESDQVSRTQWYNGNYTTIGNTKTVIGSGNENTNTIVNSQGAGGYAAKVCYDLVLNNYNDWYLPSIDELKLIYTNMKVTGMSSFVDNLYWSSSENSSNTAYIIMFANGGYGTTDKSSSCYIRAIRSF